MCGQEIIKENLGMFYLQLMYFSTQDMFLPGPFLDREPVPKGFSGGSQHYETKMFTFLCLAVSCCVKALSGIINYSF